MHVPLNPTSHFKSDFSHLDIKVKLAADKLSADVTVFWDGRNLTIHEKYSSETTVEHAKESIQKILPKMLLLADIYSIGGQEKDKPTTKITLKGKEVNRQGGKKQQKTYEEIDKHLEQKIVQNKSKKINKIVEAIEHFRLTSKTEAEEKRKEDDLAKPAPLEGKVTKELNVKQAETAKKVAKTALAILAGLVVIALAPLLLLTAGAYALGKFIADHMRISNDPKVKHLITASKEMKNSEESKKLEATMTFRDKNIASIKAVTEESLKLNIEDPKTHQKYLERIVMRELAPIAPEKMEQMLTKVHKSVDKLLNNPASVQNSNDPVDMKAKDVIERIGSKSTLNAEIAAAYFKILIDEFVAVLENIPGDTRQANELIINKFRELLECDGYQALKHDHSNPAIQFIHRFAASMWTDVKVMDSYQDFGHKALVRAKVLDKSDPQVGYETMSQAIDASIKSVDNDLFQVRRLPELIMYTVTHPLQTLYSIVSEHGWYSNAIARLVGGYDSHGNLSNNPSLQGTTKMTLGGGKEAIVDNVYGGSPTIDTLKGNGFEIKIAPEFLAVVQAAENNQIDKDNRIPGIPDKVFYTNFQNLVDKKGENLRSVEIMKLNETYPLSFLGITLSKDSDFYKMEGDVQWDGAEEMKDEMLEHLMSGSSFTFKERYTKDEGDKGFYFPGNKQTWEPIFKSVLASAVEMFDGMEATTPEKAKELRGAFQEYVYASLMLYLEVQCVQELIKQGVADPRLHSQRACKENIDRGGAANAGYLYLRLGKAKDIEDDQKQELVVGSLHCRALGARDRAILSDRLPQVLAFIKHVEPNQFWEKQKQLPIFGNVAFEFTPALAV